MLATFHTQDKDLSLLQTSWQAELNPLLANPLLKGIFVSNVVLASGANTVNHLLGRKPQGFMVTDINAAVTIYRSAAFNALTLTLTASGAATVSLYVF